MLETFRHSDDPKTARWQVIGICLFLTGITWFVFGQTLGYEFINYDDPIYILENPEVTQGLTIHGIKWAFTHKVSSNWHPLTMITHMADFQMYGRRAGGHHAANVILHTLAVLLLFLVLKKMTRMLWPSAFVAALFAIHPLRVESVAWIAERKDVLSGVFFMLTLAAYLRYVRKPSFARYLLVTLIFALGLMSKPMVVTLPFVLLLLDYWPLGRFTTKAAVADNVQSLHWWNKQSIPLKLIAEKIPLLFLSAIACGIALILQQEAMSSIAFIPLWLRIYNAVISYVIYIWQVFWPAKLALVYPLPAGVLSGWTLIFAAALLVVITLSAWIIRKRRPYVITGWLWYLGMLVPVIGLIQVGAQARADRYTYLPQIGLYIAATWFALDLSTPWRNRRVFGALLGVAVIVTLTWRARIQTSYWRNSESIWTRTLAVTSENALAEKSLGYLLLKNGETDNAILHLQESLRIWPDYGQGRSNHDNARIHDKLASALLQQGEIDGAITHWQKALSIDPDNPHVHVSLGTALLRKRLVAEAVFHYEKALAIAPRSIVTLNNLALLFSTCPDARFRNGSRAIQLAEQADQLSSGKNPLVVRTLAAAYAESGRFNDAINAAERALKLGTAQNDSALISDTQMDIDLYRMKFPRRINGP